jgi:hypothetical protein
MAKHIISPEQEIYFFTKVSEYQVMLNLQNWRIDRHLTKGNSSNLAEVATSNEDRSAVISLSKNWGEVEPTRQRLSEVALHECLHIFFREFQEASFYNNQTITEGVEHSMVIVLQKLLLTI